VIGIKSIVVDQEGLARRSGHRGRGVVSSIGVVWHVPSGIGDKRHVEELRWAMVGPVLSEVGLGIGDVQWRIPPLVPSLDDLGVGLSDRPEANRAPRSSSIISDQVFGNVDKDGGDRRARGGSERHAPELFFDSEEVDDADTSCEIGMDDDESRRHVFDRGYDLVDYQIVRGHGVNCICLEFDPHVPVCRKVASMELKEGCESIMGVGASCVRQLHLWW
jgi:hypothetical protein